MPLRSGSGTLTIPLLFAANTIVLWVFAAALMLAGWKRREEPYWESWVLANLVLGVALAVYIFDRHLPPLLVGTLPNGLLVLGLALRWRAAREFSGRHVSPWLVWAPLIVLVASIAPWIGVSYAPAFTSTNVILTALSFATAYEFWRDRADRLPSRYGLVAAYSLIGASFAFRVGQGVFVSEGMPMHIPQDLALIIHLVIAVAHTTASGAFALSLAYERSNAALAHAAERDALTGLLNRGAFETRVRQRLAGSDRTFAIALLDIDHFKRVNDRYGHAAGDEALRRCAATCRELVGDRGLVARMGGEEFALLVEGVDRPAALALVEELRRAVGTTRLHAGSRGFRVTMSGGVCHGEDAPGDFDELMRVVDLGLYDAKDKGRNRITSMAA